MRGLTAHVNSPHVAMLGRMLSLRGTPAFTMTLDISGEKLKYSQQTSLRSYGGTFEHVDSGTLSKAK